MESKARNQAESEAFSPTPTARPGLPAWIRIGAIAAASALAGGLAAAWFYRKTLNTLRDAESQAVDSESNIPDSGTDPDT